MTTKIKIIRCDNNEIINHVLLINIIYACLLNSIQNVSISDVDVQHFVLDGQLIDSRRGVLSPSELPHSACEETSVGDAEDTL